MNYRYLKTIVALLVVLILLGGCSASKNFNAGQTSYEIGEYYRATEKFRKSFRKEKDLNKRTEMAHLMAESYRNIGQYAKAAIWYKNAIRRGAADKKLVLNYADCLLADQKYEDAALFYKQYLDSVPNDARALNGLQACQLAPEWEKSPSRYVVNTIRELNSMNSDYSPVFVGGRSNEIILSSTRDLATGRAQSAITGDRNADLFRSEYQVQKQKWGDPKLLDENLVINTEMDEGAACFSARGDQMLFTRCRFDKSADLGAEIYTVKYSRGEWGEPLKIELVGDSLIAAHPALSPDGGTIYFVSDRPGGFGGKDIWMAQGDGGSYSSPVNLGEKINTPGDEMFPFLRNNGDLYFSSNYHLGMGGLDIFKAVMDDEGQWQIENLKAPINSSGDDFGICFTDEEQEKGMFSSNRKGSRSDDLYSFYLPPKIFQVSGEVYDKETGQRLDGARVRIIGTDGTNLKMRADGGRFQMKLNAETEYIFASFKDGYLNDKAKESTIGLNDSKDFRVEMHLTPADSPIRIENINYAFGSWELMEGSKQSLDSLIQILVLNPTIVIELMAHTDHVGSDQFNFDLSQKRAQSVVDYLISKGINPERLVAKGYGETWPKKVTRELARSYEFLKRNDELTEAFIANLTPEQQEIAKGINRRTEFRVLSSDFHERFEP